MDNSRFSHQFVLDEAHISCPICLDFFEEPKSLPNCAHNICKACVWKLQRGERRTVVCPECRVESTVPESGDFPTNYLLKSLVESIPGRKESKELNESLGGHKRRIEEERKNTLENIDVLSRLVREGLYSHRKKLQEDVSKITVEQIDLLRVREKHLHGKIDEILLENTASCHAQLEEIKRSFFDRNEAVIDKLSHIEEFLTTCESQVIAESRDIISQDLNNLSLGFDEDHLDELMGKIFEFKNVKFEKAVFPDRNNIVGTIVNQSNHAEVFERDQHSKSSSKIFLQNVTKHVDVKSLCGLFSPLGKIRCCEMAVNDGGEPLGCAMVHFEQEDSVAPSIKKMDGVLLDGLKLSVGRCISSDKYQSKSQRNPNTDYAYIFYPGDSLTEGRLRSLCGTSSGIRSVEEVTDADGRACGVWFVGFTSKEDASKAVEILNEKVIDGKTCIARQVKRQGRNSAAAASDTRTKRQSSLPRPSNTTVYVSNLDTRINEELLTEKFSVYGAVSGAKIIRNENGLSRGCGFLYFTSQDEAIYAAAKMNGKPLFLRNLLALYVGKTKGRNLSIKNLEDPIDEDYLRKEFSAFGDVIEVKVTRNEKDSLKGFVSFTTPEEAAIAAAQMNKNILLWKPLSVEVQQSKEERCMQLEMEFSGNQ